MDVTFTIQEITAVASRFLEEAVGYSVIAFHGEMGSGKTTFIHAVCDVKEVSSVVGSPTYAIINEYASAEGSIFHIDLYRLKSEEEALQAGVEDVLYSGNLCLVEWPERAPGIFPPNTLHVFLVAVDEFTRRIRIGDN